MKRILTIICALAFSGVALSAQNNADNICEKSQKPAYMVNVGYNRGYRADIELSWANKSLWGITSSHGFSFGNGLYIGGGAGFWADMTKNADATGWNHSYLTPVFADIKYSFTKTLVSPFVSMKGGAIVDIIRENREFARKQARKHREILAQVEAEMNLPKSFSSFAKRAQQEDLQ